MRRNLTQAMMLILVVFSLFGCGGGGGGGGGGSSSNPSISSFSAQITNAPADGATISGTVRLEVAGNGLETVQLLPQSGYTPHYADFTISADKTKATVDFDTTKLSNGKLAVRISAFNATASEIIAMTARTWNISNSASSAMTMVCAEGAGYQCSGSSILKRENGVALTRSGVQVTGKSTNDMDITATGMSIASQGKTDIRILKTGSSVSKVALLLSNLGITWDGRTERPDIIETFDPTQGRNELNTNGVVINMALPAPSNLDFYDYATLERSATQTHYANNRYFPRSEPSRCDSANCPMIETSGISNDFSGGIAHANADRNHEDGDIHAGDDKNNGILVGGSGHGVPMPGSKGYRAFENWSYQYGNLAAWFTQDTVEISEWLTVSGTEHNQNRRGMVAFGDVTVPTSVPSSDSATYSGVAYGWQSPNNTEGPTFRGNVTITVNFATRAVSIRIEGAPTGTLVANATLGVSGTDNANYLTGSFGSGGVSGRLFGPALNSAPPELGGVFSLPGSGADTIGGFIARKE